MAEGRMGGKFLLPGRNRLALLFQILRHGPRQPGMSQVVEALSLHRHVTARQLMFALCARFNHPQLAFAIAKSIA